MFKKVLLGLLSAAMILSCAVSVSAEEETATTENGFMDIVEGYIGSEYTSEDGQVIILRSVDLASKKIVLDVTNDDGEFETLNDTFSAAVIDGDTAKIIFDNSWESDYYEFDFAEVPDMTAAQKVAYFIAPSLDYTSSEYTDEWRTLKNIGACFDCDEIVKYDDEDPTAYTPAGLMKMTMVYETAEYRYEITMEKDGSAEFFGDPSEECVYRIYTLDDKLVHTGVSGNYSSIHVGDDYVSFGFFINDGATCADQGTKLFSGYYTFTTYANGDFEVNITENHANCGPECKVTTEVPNRQYVPNNHYYKCPVAKKVNRNCITEYILTRDQKAFNISANSGDYGYVYTNGYEETIHESEQYGYTFNLTKKAIKVSDNAATVVIADAQIGSGVINKAESTVELKVADIAKDTNTEVIDNAVPAEASDVKYAQIDLLIDGKVDNEEPVTFNVDVEDMFGTPEAGVTREYYAVADHEGQLIKKGPFAADENGNISISTDKLSVWGFYYVDKKEESKPENKPAFKPAAPVYVVVNTAVK